MGRFRVRKITRDGRETFSDEFESRDAAKAFARIENDKGCVDAEVWEDGRRVACAHRQGSNQAPFWLLDQKSKHE